MLRRGHHLHEGVATMAYHSLSGMWTHAALFYSRDQFSHGKVMHTPKLYGVPI